MNSSALPRRPYLGLHVNADAQSRMVVVEVLRASAAERAGVRSGDRVIAIDGETVKDAIHLLAIARDRLAGDDVTFHVEREGSLLELVGRAPPLPLETSELGAVEIGSIAMRGHRLRSIVNVPPEKGRRHAAILYVQGIRSRSCEYPLDPQATLRRLVEGFAQAGLLVLRVERSGVGDSEGPSCALTGLDVELDTYVAGIEHLRAREDVDPQRIFLFGQSLGAMTVPLLALERPVAGVIAYGASATRWVECVTDTTRSQLRLTDMPEPQIEADVARWSEMHTLICREGWTPELVFERRPHLRGLRSLDCIGETYSGRHVSLFQELDAIDLLAAWAAVGQARIPVLVARGEYDWICSREEGEAIVRAVGESARYLELPHTGHDWLTYPTFDKSREWGEGRWDGNVVRAVQTLTSPQPSGNTQP
jgi:pimeloyl-ACP methyl ester carboxylesterase